MALSRWSCSRAAAATLLHPMVVGRGVMLVRLPAPRRRCTHRSTGPPNQSASCLPMRARVTNQTDRDGLASCAARNSAAPSLTQVAPYDRSASLEVCAPAAFTGSAMRYPERPSSGRSRFGVLPLSARATADWPWAPAVRTDRTAFVAPAVFRLANAMRGSSMCGLVVCGFARFMNAPRCHGV